MGSSIRKWLSGNDRTRAAIMLRFENQPDFVEIDLAKQATGDLPSSSDARLTIRVSSSGFGGHHACWVQAQVLHAFCRALLDLERSRRGNAILRSLSPNELELVVRSADSCGHMLIEGSLGFRVQRAHTRAWHAVQFGFEFEPSQLLKAVAVDWVKRNAD
jgi:hypothetical protein